MIYLLNIAIFRCYVRLPEGIPHFQTHPTGSSSPTKIVFAGVHLPSHLLRAQVHMWSEIHSWHSLIKGFNMFQLSSGILHVYIYIYLLYIDAGRLHEDLEQMNKGCFDHCIYEFGMVLVILPFRVRR